MKIRKPLKHKGFINIPRRVTMLLKEKKLDFTDYGFYNFLLHEVDWYRPRSTYGCIPKTDIDLALDSGCSPSTISRRKAKLEKLRLIETAPNGLTKIVDFEKFSIKVVTKLAKLDVANLQEDFAQTQSAIAEVQQDFANMQQARQEKDTSFSYSPYKDIKGSNEEYVDPEDIPF
ncbi:MAG: hypothetical protein NTZ20_00990 [Candidatus Levybacteria bacterium]|nr:hypothetical protein [Candidatus Levybacteria bacterium]